MELANFTHYLTPVPTGLIVTYFQTHDQMAYHQMASAAMPATASPNHDSARGQRLIQVQYIEERLHNGISSVAVAGITVLIAQLETQPTLPSLAVSIVADVAGYKRTMTCRNAVWDDYDLTHPFLDDRSSVVRGPNLHTAIEKETTLRIPIGNVAMPQPLPPAHMMIQPRMQAPLQPPPQPLHLPIVQPNPWHLRQSTWQLMLVLKRPRRCT